MARLIADALAVAHAHGVIHRDLKPSNLFLVDRDARRAKIVDFGIARFGGAAAAMTMTGTVVGTPGYMAPEQVRGRQDIDARADVFALGCVLFECLAGVPVFQGEAFHGHPGEDPLRERAPDPRDPARRPARLDALVAQMLAKAREDRPRDGAQIADALEALVAPDTTLTSDAPAPLTARTAALTAGERRVTSVMLMAKDPLLDSASQTLDEVALSVVHEDLCRAAEKHGGELEFLPDGSARMTIARTSRVATDLRYRRRARRFRCARSSVTARWRSRQEGAR